ncbi:hypothetical protein BDZ89DRAFT_1171127 [Hymenopellis radicata]|nr:hypothetical protein BDZ89DRAFT_1171127 [Hymenopellis radicata]
MNDCEGTPRRFPYPQVLAWGDGLDNESSVFFTGYHGEGNEQRLFCVKVLFNIEKAKPDECCYQAINKMLTDAKFYARHLRDIAGILVPRHYGVWRGPTGKWGGTVLCSVTEWAGIPWDQVANVEGDFTAETDRPHSSPIQLHHILLRATKKDAEARCFIVDFSDAYIAECRRNLPILPLDANICREAMRCSETSSVAFLLDMFQRNVKMTPTTHMYRAMRFHSRYSALHPSLHNAIVMAVQRLHFFDEPPLRPDIQFRFRRNGEAVVWEGDDSEESDELAQRLSEDYIESLLS